MTAPTKPEPTDAQVARLAKMLQACERDWYASREAAETCARHLLRAGVTVPEPEYRVDCDAHWWYVRSEAGSYVVSVNRKVPHAEAAARAACDVLNGKDGAK